MTDTQAGRNTTRTWPYAVAAYAFAVTMGGTTLPTPLYGLYQEQLDFSSLLVTVVYATYAVGVIAALLLFGQLSDLVGRRPVLLTGLVLSATSAACFLAESGLPALFAGRVLSGLSAGLFTGTATVTVLELAPPRRQGRATLVATAANMGGLGAGPLLAGLLATYAPWPLRLPYVVDLALLAVAGVLLLLVPETVPGRRRRGLPRPRSPRVPSAMRSTFLSAGMAGFAGFATLGLFTAVAPSFLTEVLDEGNHAVSGAVVFSVFAASTVGQMLLGRAGVARALPLGCVTLAFGMAGIAASLALSSMALLVLGAVLAGLGQGLAFRAGMTTVGQQSPAERRGEVSSALFVVLYVAISLPVIGVGVLTVTLGLRTAGLIFTGLVAALALGTAARLARRPHAEHTPAETAR